MGNDDKKSGKILSRDPFADMQWVNGEADVEAVQPVMETSPGPGAGPQPGVAGQPQTRLEGKGVWLLYSKNVGLAIEMATAIGATHILYKTGHRGMFFVDAARRVCQRVRQAGLIPFAWPFIYCDDPNAEAEVAVKSVRVGYEGIVFDIEEQSAGRAVGAAALGRRLLEAGLDPQKLYYTSYPNIWQHLDIPYREMNMFCHGGFMPQCYPTFQRTARTVIDKWAHGEHARWSEEWGYMPPLYLILAAYKDEHALQRLNAQEFLVWAETLAAHEPSVYSIYRAGSTSQELWPILAALGKPPPVVSRPEPVEAGAETGTAPIVEPVLPDVAQPAPVAEAQPAPVAPAEAEEAPAAPAAVYHVAAVNDTVWGLCQRFGLSRDQFWEWNGQIWDDHGLPRDGLYLQEGWRLRVG